jgi:hypothetical protein
VDGVGAIGTDDPRVVVMIWCACKSVSMRCGCTKATHVVENLAVGDCGAM